MIISLREDLRLTAGREMKQATVLHTQLLKPNVFQNSQLFNGTWCR